MFEISWQIQLSLLPFRTSSYWYKSSSREREDVLKRSQGKLGDVASLKSTLVGKWRNFNRKPHEPAFLAFTVWQL